MMRMKMELERPEFVTDEHLEYLDVLRESGETNMYGAESWLIMSFPLEKDEARDVLQYWMKSFDSRHDID